MKLFYIILLVTLNFTFSKNPEEFFLKINLYTKPTTWSSNI